MPKKTPSDLGKIKELTAWMKEQKVAAFECDSAAFGRLKVSFHNLAFVREEALGGIAPPPASETPEEKAARLEREETEIREWSAGSGG
jgi:hypothetical protein